MDTSDIFQTMISSALTIALLWVTYQYKNLTAEISDSTRQSAETELKAVAQQEWKA